MPVDAFELIRRCCCGEPLPVPEWRGPARQISPLGALDGPQATTPAAAPESAPEPDLVGLGAIDGEGSAMRLGSPVAGP